MATRVKESIDSLDKWQPESRTSKTPLTYAARVKEFIDFLD